METVIYVLVGTERLHFFFLLCSLNFSASDTVWILLLTCSAFSTALPPVLEPAQQQRGTYWPGCRTGGHPWSPRGDHWNRWFVTQSLSLSPKNLFLQQLDHFTEGFTKCRHQSTDLSPKGSGEQGGEGVRWINEFWDVHSEAWSQGVERYRIITTRSPLTVYSAQWLSVGEQFATLTWVGPWPVTRKELKVLLT